MVAIAKCQKEIPSGRERERERERERALFVCVYVEDHNVSHHQQVMF